ncbi:Transcriptional regulatory protein ZraR [Porphyromonas macacae]|uniref:Transcriptional regulatory protein ZraR n=1 Tax=Porphyromonas macacae TaxID=28115 RepID=A0A379DKL9_9PORP|nr:sigma-54 dependent transcriptional regulator [Porphyromonas macacae]SUB78573.1 Transcriptional regulatory protein ZraR [Porphyromonas macacae]
MKKGKIIVVDDNQSIRTALKLLLSMEYEQVELLPSPANLLSTIDSFSPDIILLDMNFRQGINDGNEGLFWLGRIKEHTPALPVVLFTAYADIDLAVEALKRGATDFIVKPWDNRKLLNVLRSAITLNTAKSNKRINNKENPDTAQEIFWGESNAITQTKAIANKVAPSEANVLITGENGTGKEILARYIHNLSGRNKEKMVTVDMGSISETLFESELFGHVKGAFTDARTDRKGKFEEAQNSTLFLDEIANLSMPMQAKLLSALQSRTIMRVGSNTPIPIDIRLICATNANMYEAIRRGEFREDLYYRINTIQIEMPPLRERADDIAPMAEFFLKKYSQRYNRSDLSFDTEAIRTLENYSWPGNVRELQHCIEKAVILSSGALIEPEDLMLEPQKEIPVREENLSGSLEDMERRMIESAMRRHEGNMSQVANELGISRPTLYSKLKKHGL